jgi:hypothetical protein
MSEWEWEEGRSAQEWERMGCSVEGGRGTRLKSRQL